MPTKIAIVGLGFVGLTFASFIASKNFKVIGIDKDKEKISSIQKGKQPFYEPHLEGYLKKALRRGLKLQTEITRDITSYDFIFITVGTPLNEMGQINLEYVKDAARSIAEQIPFSRNIPCIVIKSTVIPGTTMQVIKPILTKYSLREFYDFNLLSNPEFLREGYAMKDTISPHVIVIGGANKSVKKLVRFYKNIYSNYHQFVETDNTTAELIKYANNAFLATKISFINSIANICQKIRGTNVDDIARVIGMDPRIGNLFLKAGPGYGGSCFPKDLQALIAFSNEIGYNPILLNAVQETNALQVKMIMDILKQNLVSLSGKKIAILGLSFKENTDDIRESVSIKLIERLLEQNCKVVVHDPKAMKNTQRVFGDKIQYRNDINDIFDDIHCMILLTPWIGYKKLDEKNLLKMKNPLVIDTRRLLKINNPKIRYIGLGIGN